MISGQFFLQCLSAKCCTTFVPQQPAKDNFPLFTLIQTGNISCVDRKPVPEQNNTDTGVVELCKV